MSEDDAGKRPKMDCQAIGYFLKKDGEALYLAHMIGKDNERDQTVIPNGCIKEIKAWKTSSTMNL